jgi:hypothetical protein
VIVWRLAARLTPTAVRESALMDRIDCLRHAERYRFCEAIFGALRPALIVETGTCLGTVTERFIVRATLTQEYIQPAIHRLGLRACYPSAARSHETGASIDPVFAGLTQLRTLPDVVAAWRSAEVGQSPSAAGRRRSPSRRTACLSPSH